MPIFLDPHLHPLREVGCTRWSPDGPPLLQLSPPPPPRHYRSVKAADNDLGCSGSAYVPRRELQGRFLMSWWGQLPLKAFPAFPLVKRYLVPHLTPSFLCPLSSLLLLLLLHKERGGCFLLLPHGTVSLSPLCGGWGVSVLIFLQRRERRKPGWLAATQL